MPLGAVAVPGRRVPASSGPNLPGPRTGAAAAPRAQLRCAARGVPVLAASLHGAGSCFSGPAAAPAVAHMAQRAAV